MQGGFSLVSWVYAGVAGLTVVLVAAPLMLLERGAQRVPD
jgi:hypothetical protein